MASSSNSSAPKIMASTSTTSIQKSFKYDVFLSFRGEDTRKRFVGHLYEALKQKGIETYKDDEKIEKGERINDQLLKSIQESRFFIIVFSKTYASSSWCLDELSKIIECQKMTEHTAFPIFYDVEPTEVCKQSGPVKEAFAVHEKKEVAGKWRDAMKELADLAGWELKATANGDESKLIQMIVDAIFIKKCSTLSNVDGKLVGMETRISDVLSSLEIGTEDVRMIGIRGMGGGGKTTLARAVYDQISNHFEGKSFVENVREVSNSSLSGLKELQKRILEDVLDKKDITFSSVHDGKNMLKATMCCRKILVVLDDVDRIEQLEALAGEPDDWFKSGSRIIITTRDEQVLISHQVKFIHDVNLLSSTEAICLFSRHAFQKELPMQGYEELSGEVVQYADGLPLTIKVLGSFLCGKDKLEWKDAIDRLKRIPLKETQEKLELSYNSLEDDHKEIFLDIACMLKRKPKAKAITILESCGFHAIIGLKVLEQRSLITVRRKHLDMHDHIEEMGKNIVRRKHLDEPNKHSRLWKYEEIEDILANDKGTEATRCLKLDLWRGKSRIVMNGLGKMKELRYLEVNFYFDSKSDLKFDDKSNRMKILGCLEVFFANYDSESDLKFDDISQCFTNSLRYLQLWNYPFLYLPKTFQANNLVGLKMKGSRMVQLWEEGERKVLIKLKFLSLSWSRLTTFDFGLSPNIETLSLEYSVNLKELCMPFSCQKLKHLHISYSKLRTFDLGLTPNLETLSLEGCAQFEELHVPVACPNLKILNLRESRLRSLDLELIPNLEELDLSYCDQLVEIKAPVGCLRKLGLLRLTGCLRFIKFTFDSRREPKVNCSLDTLNLVGDSLDSCPLHPNSNLPKFEFTCIYKEYLPSSVGNIEKLVSFGLCACTDFEKFSDMICSLQCLQKLTLSGENIPEFPKDLGQLECLEELSLHSKKIKHLPDSICMLKHLKYLRLDWCTLLEKLPEDIGQLESLEILDLSFTMIKHFPDSICMLKRLKSLDLYQCSLLEKLPDSICVLKCLKSLNVSNGDLLEKLPEDLGQLECLEELDVSSNKIEFLPDSICMLKRLKSLDVSECSCLGKLPEDIGQLESLETLDLWATNIKHLPDSICKLTQLTHLNLRYCALLEKLPEDLGQLECLVELKMSSKNIEYLPDICMLKHLEYLILDDCALLEKLPEDLGQLECLVELYVSSKKIEYLPDSICMLKRLKWLNVRDCSCLGKLPEDIGQLESLESLALSATKIKYLPDSICMLKHLKGLILFHCDLLEKLPEDLGQLECLERLRVMSKKIEYIPDSICMLKRLKSLNVNDCSCLEMLPEDVGQLESLERLDLSATSIKHLPDSICMLKHLNYLNLEDCALLEKLPEDLGKSKCLRRLIIENTGIIRDHLPPRLISASFDPWIKQSRI